ncbi:MAG TPA: UDP-N-acetylmuramoyl-L-alanine--D-glutamate ligase [Gammaproteobacteria bacterium]
MAVTLIVGLGDTGLAAARFLHARGERLRVIDSRAAPPCLEALRAACPGVEIVTGTLDARWAADAGRVIISPGLGLDVPVAAEAARRRIPLVSEIELFARAATAPVIAVTGSNGKSTVAVLVARMLEAQGFKAPAGGNLGPPALDLLEAGPADAYVLEISSFQMETTASLRPRAAAVLNVSPDHLDRHGSLERYAALKERLLAAAEHAVVNADDPLVRAMGERHPRPIPFSVTRPLGRGYSIVERGGERHLARHGAPLLPARELAIRGRHNEANALAALALVEVMGAPLAPALAALRAFPGLPHRCQRVAERGGVTYLDDSKGTNVGATLAALEGLQGPLVLIAGGVGKGADFAPLAAAARGKVKAAVLIGRAAGEIEAALAGVCPTRRADGMAEAVRLAAALAAPGDTVLLSPACASQDMFRDYRHRGEAFAAAARELPA